jgi:hypothetical protein
MLLKPMFLWPSRKRRTFMAEDAVEENGLPAHFHSIYDQINRRVGIEAPDSGQVRLAVETKQWVDYVISERELDWRVRIDARLYLSVNAYYLVVLPLVETSDFHEMGSDAIMNNVYEDTHQILADAQENARSEMITGHDIVDATSRMWAELKSTQTAIWMRAESGS